MLPLLLTCWTVYFYHVNDVKSFEEFFPEQGILTVAGKQIRPQTVNFVNGVADLDAAAPEGMDRAVLCTTVKSAAKQTVWLGIGAKAFAVYCNGKKVYGFLNKGLGNDYFPVTAKDHVFPVELQAGENQLVIQTYKTNWMLDYCYGKKRENPWHFAAALQPDYQPVRAKLAHPPWFGRPGAGEVMVTLITEQPVPAGIDIRPKGGKEWRRIWDLAGSVVLKENSRVHCFRLEDLPAGTDYEYRVILLERPAGKEGFRRALWCKFDCKEVIADTGILHLPDRENFRFFMFGDTQLSISENCRTVADRENFMKKMRRSEAYRQADFVVHAGDATSYFHHVERDLFTDFFDHFAPAPGTPARPWVYLRGNHEYNGLGAEEWFNYFLPSGEKSFYSFRYGKTLFIVLDGGDFPDDPTKTFSGPLIQRTELMRRQERWLKELKQTPEFKNAEFRIVLCHTEPRIEKSTLTADIRRITAELLADTAPQGLIHLWLAGHTHYYWRMNRGSDRVITAPGGTLPPPVGAPAPVTFLTLDGPKGDNAKPDYSYLDVSVADGKITVNVYDEDNRRIDGFTVDRNGAVEQK